MPHASPDYWELGAKVLRAHGFADAVRVYWVREFPDLANGKRINAQVLWNGETWEILMRSDMTLVMEMETFCHELAHIVSGDCKKTIPRVFDLGWLLVAAKGLLDPIVQARWATNEKAMDALAKQLYCELFEAKN